MIFVVCFYLYKEENLFVAIIRYLECFENVLLCNLSKLNITLYLFQECWGPHSNDQTTKVSKPKQPLLYSHYGNNSQLHERFVKKNLAEKFAHKKAPTDVIAINIFFHSVDAVLSRSVTFTRQPTCHNHLFHWTVRERMVTRIKLWKNWNNTI